MSPRVARKITIAQAERRPSTACRCCSWLIPGYLCGFSSRSLPGSDQQECRRDANPARDTHWLGRRGT